MVQTGPPELATLARVAPGAHDALLDAAECAERALDPELLKPLRRRIAALLGDEDGDDRERTEVALARHLEDLTDQFVVYVPGVTDDLRQPLQDALGTDALRMLVKGLYTVETAYRLRLVHRQLFSAGDVPLAPLAPRMLRDGRTMDSALIDLWREATILADSVVNDPETIEFLRLRCAWYHDCHA